MSAELLKKIRKITALYAEGKATQEQIKALERYYELFEEAPDAGAKITPLEQSEIGREIFERIQSRKAGLRVVPIYRKWWFAAAAAIVVAIAVILTLKNTSDITSRDAKLNTASKPTDYKSVAFTRNLTLPDGSRVVLRGNSRLVLEVGFNRKKTREVTLIGEAFFDVKHDSAHPFIIHTGKIKTTVLGTAFNITTGVGKTIVVKVLRGRVKVENGQRLLAVLKPNQQLTANMVQTEDFSSSKVVNTTKPLKWASEGMTFENMPYGKLAAFIGQRYGVTITFKNLQLKECPITGSFTGTESLEEILNILSVARGTNFTITGNEVTIDGKECK
jgi:transmembrane sensor